MPPVLSKPSSAAPTALVFITLGALLTIWSGLWFVYLQNYPPTQKLVHYVDAGFLLTGLVFVAIGFFVGPVARMARQAELPPSEVTPVVAQREVEQRV
jgi:hypothetical protein